MLMKQHAIHHSRYLKEEKKTVFWVFGILRWNLHWQDFCVCDRLVLKECNEEEKIATTTTIKEGKKDKKWKFTIKWHTHTHTHMQYIEHICGEVNGFNSNLVHKINETKRLNLWHSKILFFTHCLIQQNQSLESFNMILSRASFRKDDYNQKKKRKKRLVWKFIVFSLKKRNNKNQIKSFLKKVNK